MARHSLRMFAAVESLGQDVRYAGRMIRRTPGLSFIIIAIVAITIAASTTLYTLADACVIALKPE